MTDNDIDSDSDLVINFGSVSDGFATFGFFFHVCVFDFFYFFYIFFLTCHLCVAEVTRSVLLFKLHTGRHLGYIEGSCMTIHDASKNQLSMKKRKRNHI